MRLVGVGVGWKIRACGERCAGAAVEKNTDAAAAATKAPRLRTYSFGTVRKSRASKAKMLAPLVPLPCRY